MTPALTSKRFWVRLGAGALILNELRGIAVVIATWPIWSAAITSMFHAAMRGR